MSARQTAGERRSHSMPHGAQLTPDGGVRFRLWAPAANGVKVIVEGDDAPIAMHKANGGWYELTTDRARAGTRYRFLLPDGARVPDPASRFQPEDVQGPSEVIDPASFRWDDAAWQGRPWHEAVLYELHIGTFTPQGTFLGAIEKLDHLVALGVTALQIMPIGDFSGMRNWGYDGVLPYAPDSAYGRPEAFKALIAAAHRRGLMVLLDVIYNHFGPEGNYLSAYAPQFFTDRHKTPWGAAINYDGADARPVRDFVIDNALYWIEEYNLDGLRLDAVHAIFDDSEVHILDELARRVHDFARDRPIHLVLENEENQARWLGRLSPRQPIQYTAQWNDDVHHVLHTAASGEASGYYREYLGDTEKLGRALAEGFVFQGQLMVYRGEPRGEPSAHLPPDAFVAFIQNHDQVGNRAFGDRLAATTPSPALKAIAAVYLLLPQIPMLFMGEEWGAAQPFPFFCDFRGELANAVREGRRAEFARFPEFRDPHKRSQIPDPLALETFMSAKLEWSELGRKPHAAWLIWYRGILAARHSTLIPLLPEISRNAGSYKVHGPSAVSVRWRVGSHAAFTLEANLSNVPVIGFAAPHGAVIWQEGQASSDSEFGPWTVRWSFDTGDEKDLLNKSVASAVTK